MPAKNSRKSNPRSHRLPVRLTTEELMQLKADARTASLPLSAYVRQLIVSSARGQPATPARRKPPSAFTDEQLAVGINQLHLQLTRIGTNINQLAHQANAGMVPIAPNVLMKTFDDLQTPLRLATVFLDRVLR